MESHVHELQVSPRLPDQNTSASQLLTMPQEILDRIAEFVLDLDFYLSIMWEPENKRWLESNGCYLLNLAKTCRLLSMTGIKQLYSKSHFQFEDEDDPDIEIRKSASATFVAFVQ